jgi:hypothetical protein
MVKKIGTRNEVFDGLALQTSGGLTINDLVTNAKGKVVSKKLQDKGHAMFEKRIGKIPKKDEVQYKKMRESKSEELEDSSDSDKEKNDEENDEENDSYSDASSNASSKDDSYSDASSADDSDLDSGYVVEDDGGGHDTKQPR